MFTNLSTLRDEMVYFRLRTGLCVRLKYLKGSGRMIDGLYCGVTGFEMCSTKTLCVDPVGTHDVRYLRLVPPS